MLTSPITLTIDGNNVSLSRINQDNFSSVYYHKAATGAEYRLTIRHSYEGKALVGQMERHNFDLLYTRWDATTARPIITQVYGVMRLERGDDPANCINLAAGLFTWAESTSDSLVAWES